MRHVHAWTVLATAAGMSLMTAGILPIQSQEKPAAPKKPASHMNIFKQAKPDDYVGEKACVECHPEQAASFNKSPHASFVRDPHAPVSQQGCEACHGPGKPHMDHMDDEAQIPNYIFGYTKASGKDQAEACLRCHKDVMSEAHWRRTEHARAGIGCTACHSIHNPAVIKKPAAPTPITSANSLVSDVYVAKPDPKRLLKADEPALCGSCHPRVIGEFRQNFHHPVPEGRMACSDCHDPHPTQASQKRIRPGRSMCVTCHADTAGPFAYEHDPVAGWTGEGCVECHRPHGSPNPRLLKLFSRGLCAQCHTDKLVNHNPGQTCWQGPCHVAPHGSNTDANLLSR